jgi:hypothetical protein
MKGLAIASMRPDQAPTQATVLVQYVRYTSMPTDARNSAGVRWPSDW